VGSTKGISKDGMSLNIRVDLDKVVYTQVDISIPSHIVIQNNDCKLYVVCREDDLNACLAGPFTRKDLNQYSGQPGECVREADSDKILYKFLPGVQSR